MNDKTLKRDHETYKRRVTQGDVKRYSTFHGRAPDKTRTLEITWPNALILLGDGVAVEYESEKLARNVPKGKNIYRHKFGRGVKLYTDKGGKILVIHGGKFHVTDWLRG